MVWGVVWAVFGVLVAVSIVRRTRRGGPGVRVGYIPPRLRPATNRYFARQGWPQPFDDEGRRITPQDH